MDVVNIYGRFGNVEARRGQEEETQSHGGMQPQSKEGKYYVNAYELAQKSNISLIDLAFSPLKSSKYGAIIRRHFIDNSGQNNVMEMSSWISEFTGKIDLFNSIRNHMPNFRISPANLSEMIAVGGVQEVEIKNDTIRESFEQNFLDRYGKGYSKPHTANIKLNIMIKDWYGVDESDFTNNRPVAQISRDSLTALWVLQHQRGYRPFINILQYTHNLKITF